MDEEWKQVLLYGSFLIFLMIVLMVSPLIYRKIKQSQRRKGISIIKVPKQKSLPIYRKTLLWIFVELVILLAIAYILQNNLFKDFFPYYMIVPLICILFFFYKFGYQKSLYLLKDEENVVEYNNNINDYSAIQSLHLHLHLNKGINIHYIKGKCEYLKLNNGVEIWSCYTHNFDGESHISSNAIFSTVDYKKSESKSDIYVNINPLEQSNKNKYYLSKYSNLPPIVISDNEDSRKVCQEIEDCCSKFFSKVRLGYVLLIDNDSIGLALELAKFGEYRRLINTEKTKKMVEEAVNEISAFLEQIRDIIQNDDTQQ